MLVTSFWIWTNFFKNIILKLYIYVMCDIENQWSLINDLKYLKFKFNFKK